MITCNWIAAQVLTAGVMAHDGCGSQPTLVEYILKALGISSLD